MGIAFMQRLVSVDMKCKGFIVFVMTGLFVLGGLWNVPEALAYDELATERLPFAVDAFDAAFDRQKNLHIIYALDGKVYSVMRPPGKNDYTPPKIMDSTGPDIALGGDERGPKLALGSRGKMYAVWQTSGGLRFVFSEDGGKHWSSMIVRDSGAGKGVDMPSVATGPNGEVYVAWVDYRDPPLPDDMVAANIYLDVSTNGTFGKDRNITAGGIRACPCCQLAMQVDDQGQVWVAYRSSEKDIKETHLLRLTPGGGRIRSIPLSNHNWFFQACPMIGPVVSVNPDGKNIVVMWTSEGVMFNSFSLDGGKSFSPPTRLGIGNYRATAVSPAGTQLLIWDEGPQTGVQLLGSPTIKRIDIYPKGKLLATPAGRFLQLKAANR